MVESILIGLVGLGIGVVTTVALALLVVIYNNVKTPSDKSKDDEEEGMFAMPMSALLGGGGRNVSMAELQAYAAQQKAALATAGPPEDAKKATEAGGNYI